MSLLLVPASRANLESSIEREVDLSFVAQYLPESFISEIIRYSGNEGIRCWAMTKTNFTTFKRIQNGDEVLLTEKRTGVFTHYAVVIGKIQHEQFGRALWPFAGKNPWENIYFLAGVTKVQIDKAGLVSKLGYSDNYAVPGVVMVRKEGYDRIGTISKRFEIPVFDNVREVNTDRDFSTENILALGKRRKGQDKFSKEIKGNYEYKCSICGIKEPEFLVAGHISSWAEDVKNRLNPSNGICFCSLHDKAFEHGYMGVDDNFKVVINTKIDRNSPLHDLLSGLHGRRISLPQNDHPDKELLKKHREKHKLGEYGNKRT